MAQQMKPWTILRGEAERLKREALATFKRVKASYNDPSADRDKLIEEKKEAKKLEARAEELLAIASGMAFANANTENTQYEVVDLHAQLTDHAEIIARAFLLCCSRTPTISELYIITGWGKPKPGQPVKPPEETGKILKAVGKLLEDEKMLYELSNDGCYQVTFRDMDRSKMFGFLSMPVEQYSIPWF